MHLEPGETLSVGETHKDSLLFVHAGAGALTLAPEQYPLPARRAALVLAGETATLTADAGGIGFFRALVGREADRHAPLGERQVTASLDDGDADAAIGSRSFQVLFGPQNGSTRATLFAGFVPPGKAPWHFHLYDEIVWISRGAGRVHRGDGAEELAPGSAFRLRPREVHIVENRGADTLELLGVFTPAGSPSAAYLAG